MLRFFFMLVLFSHSLLFAQTDSLEQHLQTIIIKDKRLELKYSETSRSIDIIDRSAIERSPAQSVAELLQYVAGIDIRRRGVKGIQADMSIRGGTFDQALIMINGISMADPQTGHHMMNIPIDINIIDRIEILKGPGSRRYGQNAFSGAINIITKSSDQTSLTVNSGFSTNTTGEFGLVASIPANGAVHNISISKSFSEGYRYNTDYELDNLFLQSIIDINGHDLILNGGYSNREFGANGFYASPAFTEQYEEVGTSIISAEYRVKGKNWNFKPSVYWRRNQDEYIFVRNNPSIYRNLHIGNSYVTELNASNFNSLGVLGVGMEIRIDDLQSNNLGERSRTTFGMNIEERFSIADGKLDITPGFALYSYSDFGTRLFPGIDAGWILNSNLKVYANVGSTWRVPTYTDLYYSDPANLGNPDLTPETGVTYEAGIKWLHGRESLSAAAFVRNSDDLIDWTKENEDDQWYPSNIGNVEVRGLELTGKFTFGEDHDDPSLSVGYSYLDGENKIDANISRYALDLISHQLVIGLNYHLNKNWNHNTFFRVEDRLDLQNYSLLDTRLSYSNNSFTFALYANNLFDEMYTETNLVPMPGRWMGMSVGYKIK